MLLSEPSSLQMLHSEDMDFAADMFRPKNDRPFSESFHFAGAANRILLQGVAAQKWVFSQRVENSQQLFALPPGKRSENVQRRVINGVVVAHNYFPSEESLS